MELVRHQLARAVEEAAAKAQRAGALPPVGLPMVAIERPQNERHGDYATGVSLKMARSASMKPLDIAQRLAEHFEPPASISSAEVAPPGFINFSLSDSWLQRQVETVLDERDRFCNIDLGKGARIQVEFVSVNPTGPVHIGHGRGAVLGSALGNILEAAGYDVQKEYYVNDAGNQIESFKRSLFARVGQALGLQAEMPLDGYMGGYMKDLAEEVLAGRERGEISERVREDPHGMSEQIGGDGLRRMLGQIRDDLAALGVNFDEWFSERSLFETGQYDETMGELRGKGYLVEREGATWFTSTTLGEDKDNVLVRSNGSPTYFASDIAYHRNKLALRGFDRVIDIWGADHQGHVPRMKASLEALGLDSDRLTVLLSQLVTLRRGGEVVRASKRTGELVTLREVIDEVGADVCRFFLLSSAATSQMDFDLEAAKVESKENPGHYVKYAHARIAGILREARGHGVEYSDGDVSLLEHEAELALVRRMLQLPELVESMATSLEPHHLCHYAKELATAFHWFYEKCRVVSDAHPEMTAARLKLVEAARIALARTLGLMGISAPEQM